MVILSSFFPPLFPDELLYSILARFHLYVGNHSSKATIADLYGNLSACAVTGLPAHIEQIARLMNGKLSSREILQNHTLLPYYAAFLPADCIRLVEEAMIGDFGEAVRARLGLLACSVKMPVFLRYCDKCMIEDSEKYGVPYWHRSHQLPGVFICHKHKHVLHDSMIPNTLRRNRHEYVHLNGDHLGKVSKEDTFNKKQFDNLYYIAQQSHYLLNIPYEKSNLQTVTDMYRSSLYKQASISPGGNIYFQKLRTEMYERLGSDLLKICCSVINGRSHDTWVHKLLRGKDQCHPLRHVIMLLFINETVESAMVERNERYHPFGKGPWPCLNKASDHYKSEIVDQCSVTRCTDTRLPVGTFRCSCGFIYSRRGPDVRPEDRMKIGRIKKFGEIWETKFKELQVDADLSLRQKAALLGVHYSTVQLKLRAPNNIAISVDSALDSIEYPSIIRQLNRSQPRSSVEVQPEDDVKKDKRSSRPLRIDWSCRDRELAPFILQAVIDIKTFNHKPIRVTISEIGRRLNKLSLLEKKLHCLPICKNVLDDVVETIEQFQLRRIRLAVEKLYQEEASVVRWKVIRKAGLRKEVAQKLQIEIDRLVNDHNASQWRINKHIV